MKPQAPYLIWNEAAQMTGYGKMASASDGAKALRILREKHGDKFDMAFRLRMMTVRADTLEQLLEDWQYE